MVGVGAGLGEHPQYQGVGGADRLCFDRQVSVTSSSGILSVTLVEFGWAGEGPDSGCHRGREGEEDRCLKVILSTRTVENNKVIH